MQRINFWKSAQEKHENFISALTCNAVSTPEWKEA